MSNFRELITQTFPELDWTGGSEFHVSYADSIVGVPNLPPVEAIETLVDTDVFGCLYDFLVETYAPLKFSITRRGFVVMLAGDALRSLQDEPLNLGGVTITNPNTGNVFHVIAVSTDFIGAIRFWTFGGSIKFRFRIVAGDTLDSSVLSSLCEEADGYLQSCGILYQTEQPNVIEQELKVVEVLS